MRWWWRSGGRLRCRGPEEKVVQEEQKVRADLPVCDKDLFADPAIKWSSLLALAEVLSTSLNNFSRNCECQKRKDLKRGL